MELKKRIAENLIELRSSYNYTQKEISKLLGIAQQTYAGYESGRHLINIEKLIELSEIYNCSIDFIVDRVVCKSEFSGYEKYCKNCFFQEDCKNDF